MRRLPAAIITVLVLASGLAITAAVPAPAFASSGWTTICKSPNYGYSCVAYTGYTGQSTWGYPVNSPSGAHNCTNYVAYRLAQNGAANPGNLGNATDWDNNAAAKGFLVDGNAVVGSVAQWEGNTGPATGVPEGHVAYVEAVTSTYIDVSQDAWGGTTSTARIMRGGSWWPSHFIHIKDQPSGSTGSDGSNRIAAVTNDGTFFAKDGISGAWVDELGYVRSGYLAGDRIGALATDGTLYAKDGISGAWANELGGVESAVFDGNRIAAVTTNGTLYAKDGLGGAWVNELGDVRSAYLAGDRIGALTTDGTLYAKDGISGAWANELGGVESAVFDGNRIAAVTTNGTLYAKDGLGGTWINELGYVRKVYLAGDRIGALTTDGTLYAKDGISGAWANELGGVRSGSLEGNRIAAVTTDGTLYAKDGISGAWVNELGGVASAYLVGDRIGALTADGTLWAKDGIGGGWANEIGGVQAACVGPMTCTPDAILNRTPPSITGSAVVGGALHASSGTWNVPGPTISYQWLANGAAISGATATSLTLDAAEYGNQISVRVTGTSPGYRSGQATSAKTAPVAAGVIANSAPPWISGTRRVGYTLSAKVGTWSPGGLSFRYQWFRDSTAIRGATGPTYRPPQSARGHRICVRVTASRAGYANARRYSGYTGTIR